MPLLKQLRRTSNGQALALALLPALGLACVSTAPPLATELEALVDASRQLEGRLDRYASSEGNFRSPEGETTFQAWFDLSELLIVRAVMKGLNGNNRETHAYFRNNKPFYGVEWAQLEFQGRTELQVFFDKSGTLIGSRSEMDNQLVALPAGQPQALVQHIARLKRDADRTQGPGRKITFDLSQLNSLGLAGPPLRAIRYVYCIPASDSDAATVKAIDPSTQINRDGGAPCESSAWRATGTTHQPAYADTLMKLAELPFVNRITEAKPRKPSPGPADPS